MESLRSGALLGGAQLNRCWNWSSPLNSLNNWDLTANVPLNLLANFMPILSCMPTTCYHSRLFEPMWLAHPSSSQSIQIANTNLHGPPQPSPPGQLPAAQHICFIPGLLLCDQGTPDTAVQLACPSTAAL
eukprot:1137788-Pelagomonas_calceolata.AAC.1